MTRRGQPSGGWRRGRAARPLLAAAIAAVAVVPVVPALADFGEFDSSDPPRPSDSPRVDTPDDPMFDPCEADDEDTPAQECGSYFAEQFGSFGFNPDSATEPPPFGTGGRTDYEDCSQLDAQGRQANEDAGDPECSQLSGVRADTAWKYSTGDPETVVAILDTGAEWQEEELVEKVHLNTAELRAPQIGGAALMDDAECGDYLPRSERRDPYDADDDGAVNVRDYACDARLSTADGDSEADSLLDPSDLIARFSDGSDADRNGYVDDIAGWDFFDDDNDPFDASSCCSAEGHGTGRALEAAAETDNGEGATGMCPECQVMPLRVWDTFVVDTNRFALGVVYATDNGAAVVEGAVGGLLNSSFARRSFAYADRRGVALMLVSSDINSANHNYPTNYNEAVYVSGSLPDSAPLDCGVGSPPGVDVGDFEIPGCREFFEFLSGISDGATPPSTQPPTTSFFRNSNLTQYGGKADIVLMGATGSENTGQSAGAAGLLSSYGRDELRTPLTGNEIRQLLTMTAEDVLPANTGEIGLPDKARAGWDPHFGYGRVNLAGAMRRIRSGRIPPEAQLDGPDWFAPINVDRVGAGGVPIQGRVASPHVRVGAWEVEYACGQDASDASFQPVPGASGAGPVDGVLGRLPRSLLRDLARDCDGSVAGDAGRPAGRQTDAWPQDPYPDPDPERHAFQIRLTAHEAGDAGNLGVYRKTLFAYRDDGNRPGWPRPIGPNADAGELVTGGGGETPPRLVDLDADNALDVVLGTSSGELLVLDERGRPLPSFNGGEPVRTRPYAVAARHERGAGSLSGDPREPVRAPAVGDLDGDGEPEIVATAGEHVYAWRRDGAEVPGFPARIDRALSEPCAGGAAAKPCFDAGERLITTDHHIKRGFFGAPALVDLDGDEGLEVVAGSLDQHVYAFDSDGSRLDSFNGGDPVELDGDGNPETGAEIVTSPATADLDGDGDKEVVIATNEVIDGEDEPPDVPAGIMDALIQGAVGSNVVYALERDGSEVAGDWPVEIGTLSGDILPLVVPSSDAAALNADGNPADDEVVVSAATGDAKLVDGDGDELQVFENDASGSPNVLDRGPQINLADYPSVGELVDGTGPSVVKNGISLNGVANLLAVNQNLPFNHSVQAWNPQTGAYLPSYPVATDDFQLVSQPAIAKVDGLAPPGGSGPSRHALVGTGLYQLHAYGPLGDEAAGSGDRRWPKFLGGWVQPTPAVGDVDADGKLDVAAVTREGWSFVWETSADACAEGPATTNEEWWTFGHDEFASHNYRTDARPPSRPGPLAVSAADGDDLRLRFAASGDDLACGTPAGYEAAGSDAPIRSGRDFERAEGLDVGSSDARRSGAAGSGDEDGESLTVQGGERFGYVAIRAEDDAENVSYVRSGRTTGSGDGDGGGQGGGGDDGDGGAGSGAGSGPDGDVLGEGNGDGAAGSVGADGGASDDGLAEEAAGTESSGSGGDLPFTGLGLMALVAIGVVLVSGGAYLRRRSS